VKINFNFYLHGGMHSMLRIEGKRSTYSEDNNMKHRQQIAMHCIFDYTAPDCWNCKGIPYGGLVTPAISAKFPDNA
jgi:hypothetical protein